MAPSLTDGQMQSISCVICRRRKIKCDRRPITCANCSKFGAPCSYDSRLSSLATSASGPGLGSTHSRPGGASSSTSTSTSTTTQAGLLRRRILRSCTACKRAKAKCSGGASCTRCTRRAISCVYDGGRRDGASSPAPALEPALAPDPIPALAAEDTDSPVATFPSPVSVGHDAGVLSSSTSTSPPQPLAPAPAIPGWLASSELPPLSRLRALLDIYFVRIHSLRCMGFLHMPTFYERLNDPSSLYADVYGLVHALCALAAPFAYADAFALSLSSPSSLSATTTTTTTTTTTAAPRFYDAGSGWAATAMQRVFLHLGTPDVESLMTEMLVHEYYLRNGEYAKAFMLSGVVARHVQVLQLNLEHDCDLPSQQRRGGASSSLSSSLSTNAAITWSTKESRRRLVWCCFLQDAFMECGIDQLRFVNPADIQVQLPCTEELFVRSKPCVTEMLTPGRLQPFVDSPTAPAASTASTASDPTAATDAARNLDLRAYYIRAMAIRAKVLKYVKNLHGDVPWSTDPRESRFAALDRELRALEVSIPKELRMNLENTCVFRWSGLSGAGGSGRLCLYYGLHILLAQTFNDLYRVGVANLVFPHHATLWIRTHAPLAFLVRCHAMCSSKAVVIATLLEELWLTDRLSLVDTPYAMHAQVCSSVLVMTMSSWQVLLKRCQKRRGVGGNIELSTAEIFQGLEGQDPLPMTTPLFLPQHHRLLKSNLAILDFLRAYIKADLYYESARQALRRFEQLEAAAGSVGDDGPSMASGGGAAAESPQHSLEYILNPLGVYPMARQQARNRHEPEASVAPSSPPPAATTSSRRTRHAPVVNAPVANAPEQSSPASANVVLQPPYPPRPTMVYDVTTANILPAHTHSNMSRYDMMHQPPPPQLPHLPPQPTMLGGLGTPDASELSLFQMWDWESEVPSMDNMGYPTFLEAFQVPP